MNFSQHRSASHIPHKHLVSWWQCVLVLLTTLSSTLALAVSPVVTVSSTENPTPSGKGSAFIIAQVRGDIAGSPLPSGTVSFFSNKPNPFTQLCVMTLGGNIGNNTAETACKLPASAVVGTHSVVAVYNGNVYWRGTTSDTLALDVVQSYTVTANAIGGTASPTSRTFVMRNFGVGVDFTTTAGYRFVRVDTTAGCGSGTAVPTGPNTYRADVGPITGNCTVTGVFTNTALVTFSAGPGGRTSPFTNRSVPFGSTTQVTATPDPGYRLTNVSGCGIVFVGGPAITGPTTWTTAAINADCLIEAYFTALPSITVTSAAGAGGSITPASQSVLTNTTAQFTVTPNSGFAVASVNGCGGSLSGSVYTTAPITSACSVSASFTPSNVAPTPVSMVEFYHPPLNYYFLTSRANEIALLDVTPPFTRTGQSFSVYRTSVAGTQPITRFYFDRVAVNALRGSHFYTALNAEVLALHGLNPTNSNAAGQPFDEGIDSYAFLPVVAGVGGSCAAGQTPVFRLFRGNQRFPDDPNHRFTTSTTIYNSFVAQGWDGEGVKLCVPQ